MKQDINKNINIDILDCTLRDGGYINNWEFGKSNIKKILTNLNQTNIEYIECGFLKNEKQNKNKSLFASTKELTKITPKANKNTKYTLMINYGEYDINQISNTNKKDIIFRVAFKKAQLKESMIFCKKLKEKGYDIFINPMHTNTYNIYELIDLIKEANSIKPIALSIVDTTGGMKKNDISTYFYTINSLLNKEISLCFHSHNNLQLSFSNAQCLMDICTDRNLIIDSTIFGIGRGAGNLKTELITQYINDNYNKKYNIIPILKTIDEQIKPIFEKTPWGYSVPYYLAAINHCHPDYAKYLIDKKFPVDLVNKILNSIPNDKKSTCDIETINQIYSNVNVY